MRKLYLKKKNNNNYVVGGKSFNEKSFTEWICAYRHFINCVHELRSKGDTGVMGFEKALKARKP